MGSDGERTAAPSGATPASRRPGLALDIAALVFVGFFWGVQFAFNKVQLETIPPFSGVALRLLVAAVFLWAIVAWRRDPIPWEKVGWRDFALQAILTAAGPGVMVMWSQQYIDSALAAILNSTTPIFATLITLMVTRHEAVGWRKVAGIAVGLGGVIAVVGIDALKGIDKGLVGQVVVLLSAVGYGIAAIFGRRFGVMSPVAAAACVCTCSTAMMLAVALVWEAPWQLAPSWRSLAAGVVSGILCNGVAVILYYRLIMRLGSISASSLGYLKAAFGVVIGCLVLGEPFTATILLGLAAVAIGVAGITDQSGVRKPAAPEAASKRAPA
jgi:drug/metabolite transporter (DMT)-like permease